MLLDILWSYILSYDQKLKILQDKNSFTIPTLPNIAWQLHHSTEYRLCPLVIPGLAATAQQFQRASHCHHIARPGDPNLNSICFFY